MLYYKQAVARQVKHNYESKDYVTSKKTEKSLKKLLTNKKQRVKLNKLSLQ